MEEIIVVEKLNKSYQHKSAVHDLCFTVCQGEIVGLLGPNGAGKSTTINILSTILKPDSGNVSIGGYDLARDKSKIKKFIGIVPQDLAIYEEISAEKNVAFFASLYGLHGSELKAQTCKALQQVGLYNHRAEKPKTFSGGMKRRLNIACAIAHAPKLIIMDEPTVGIDPQSRNHILEAILTLRDQGSTILYSTHYMEEVEAIADRILILDEGNLIASGTKKELCQRFENQVTYSFTLDRKPDGTMLTLSGLPGILSVSFEEQGLAVTVDITNENLSHIISTILSAGYQIKAMSSKEASLETVFLDLTGKSLRD